VKLTEDGTLEGDVTVEYSGQLDIEMKRLNDDDSPNNAARPARRNQEADEHRRTRRHQIEGNHWISSNISLTAITCRGYAQRTDNICFQPAFLSGIEPLFSSSSRKFDVYFHYPCRSMMSLD
jgi:hypothetical protein